jgi:predicted alpha/beta-fold hydrolase
VRLDAALGEKPQRLSRIRTLSYAEDVYFHSLMLELNSRYKAAWWLANPHLQTLWGKFLRRAPVQTTSLERLDTPDGDFLDLHHLEGPSDAPLLILLHGLEGGVRSHYIQGLLGQAKSRGWKATVLVFRSCGPEMNRTRRSYHSGETTDLDLVIRLLSRRHPSSQLLLAGASLGGNVLLKYLGEQGREISDRIRSAVAISVPFDLGKASRHIGKGFARIYQRHFLRSLRRKALTKLGQHPDLVPADKLSSAATLFDFDDVFTAPVHGFSDANDYYGRSSSLHFLPSISIRTLLLSAVDDPFLPAHVLADVQQVAAGNPYIEIEFTARGGHVGFVGGRSPFGPTYYLESRAGDFLAEQL